MTPEQNVKKLAELIKNIKVAMLTTLTQDGTLRSRPMLTQQKEFDGALWFFTRSPGGLVDEILKDPRVNVSYSSPDDDRYVSVTGTAEQVRDPKKVKELWAPALKTWFPEGQDDPALALLRIVPQRAEYWDSASSTLVHLAGFTGKS